MAVLLLVQTYMVHAMLKRLLQMDSDCHRDSTTLPNRKVVRGYGTDRGPLNEIHPSSSPSSKGVPRTISLGLLPVGYHNLTTLDFPATAFTIDKELCSHLSWKNMLKEDAFLQKFATQFPNAVVEHDYSGVDCDVAIIAAGFQRSGSTLQAKLLQTAAHLLNARVVDGFWQLHLELWRVGTRETISSREQAETREYYDNMTRWMKVPDSWQMKNPMLFNPQRPPPLVVVMKTHQYDDKLRSLCRNQIVYTARRELEPVVASMKKNHFIETLDDAIISLDMGFKNYACWREYAVAEEWLYEDMLRDPVEMVFKAIESLKPFLPGTDTTHIDRDDVRRTVEATVSGTLAKHFGISNPNNTGRGSMLPPGWLEVLRTRYRSLGMSP